MVVEREATVVVRVPYHIKMYLHTVYKEEYANVLHTVEETMMEVLKGEPAHIAEQTLRPFFVDCERLVGRWLVRLHYYLAHQIDCDPSTLLPDQATSSFTSYMRLLNQHYVLIMEKITNCTHSGSFSDRWTLRFFWIQEFVDALHAAVMMKLERRTLAHGMALFRVILGTAMDWLSEYERTVKKDAHYGFIRPPDEPNIKFTRFGYWTTPDILRMGMAKKKVQYDLLLKNAQYYRALNMLDVSLYSYDDVEAYVQVSKALITPLGRQRHLRFLTVQLYERSKQVKSRWEREKQTQLGEYFKTAKLMWSLWYGLTLPTIASLESTQKSLAGSTLVDLFNFGLKGITLLIINGNYLEGAKFWDLYLASIDVILRAIQPDLLPVFKRIQVHYRTFLEIWSEPQIRESMIKLQGYRPDGLYSTELEAAMWKDLVLLEMQELLGKRMIHPKIVEFVVGL